MALSKTTRILALFILGLSVACVALLVSLVIKTNNSSESGMNVYLFGNLSVEEKNKFKNMEGYRRKEKKMGFLPLKLRF